MTSETRVNIYSKNYKDWEQSLQDICMLNYFSSIFHRPPVHVCSHIGSDGHCETTVRRSNYLGIIHKIFLQTRACFMSFYVSNLPDPVITKYRFTK